MRLTYSIIYCINHLKLELVMQSLVQNLDLELIGIWKRSRDFLLKNDGELVGKGSWSY